MPLTNVRVESAKPSAKPYKFADEKGLYLFVQPTGHKWWRLKYRFGPRKDGKPGKAEKVFAARCVPRSVAESCPRETRRSATTHYGMASTRQLIAKGKEHAQHVALLNTFAAVARHG